jgi:hypothetical protein
MHPRLRLNLILLALVALLGLWVWQAQSPGFTPLTPLDPAQVKQIAIGDLSGRQVNLQKRDGVWYSGALPANTQRIEQLLGICQTPSLERFLAPTELTPFGLDPAPIQLQLDGLLLKIGASDPIHGWRYVLIEGEIHLIADGFYHHLTAPPEAWLENPDARTAGG